MACERPGPPPAPGPSARASQVGAGLGGGGRQRGRGDPAGPRPPAPPPRRPAGSRRCGIRTGSGARPGLPGAAPGAPPAAAPRGGGRPPSLGRRAAIWWRLRNDGRGRAQVRGGAGPAVSGRAGRGGDGAAPAAPSAAPLSPLSPLSLGRGRGSPGSSVARQYCLRPVPWGPPARRSAPGASIAVMVERSHGGKQGPALRPARHGPRG